MVTSLTLDLTLVSARICCLAERYALYQRTDSPMIAAMPCLQWTIVVLHTLAMQYQAQADRNKLALVTCKQHIRRAKPAAKTQKELAKANDERAEAELVMSRLKKEGGEHSVVNTSELSFNPIHLL